MSATGDLLRFIDASPSPFHAVQTVSGRLEAAGFLRLDEADSWSLDGGQGYYLERGGTLVAWINSPTAATSGFRIVGAHTDSPNLRVKPRPDTGRAGFRQLGVEVYGSALLNSWLDRDLGLSGRVSLRSGATAEEVLFRVDRPLFRIPQLAIHLDRGVNDGLKLNAQQHLVPVWGDGPVDDGGFSRFLAKELGVPVDTVLAWDAMLDDLMPARLLGRDEEFIAAPRIDNLLSCWAATVALVQIADAGTGHERSPLVCLFDHEEIGSTSSSGAASPVLPATLERIVLARGGRRDDYHRSLALSACVSADGAHATHPNYPDRHEPDHPIAINGGPVIKINSNVRYATDAGSSSLFRLACESVAVPCQEFVVRTDMGCGSTIGPITAARLGVPIVDVGAPMLSMHSAREMCGSADPPLLAAALQAFLEA